MDKTVTMARSADSSSGAGARALARRPSNRRQNTSFFRVRVKARVVGLQQTYKLMFFYPGGQNEVGQIR